MKILVGTPAYGDRVMNGYHASIVDLVRAFARAAPDIEFVHKVIDVPVLATARNIMASIVLNDPSFTHLLFIDADMGFSPTLIARMLAFRKPFIGSIYPSKTDSFDAFMDLAKKHPEASTLQLRLAASRYICGGEAILRNVVGGGQGLEVIDGFVRVKASGTGIMLIERGVFEHLRDRLPDMWISEPGEAVRRWGLEQGGLFRGFDTIVNPDGYHVGEDIAFCLRWVLDGGEIWAAIDEAIVHSGIGYYRGHALTALKTKKRRVREVRRRSKGAKDPWFRRVLAERT